MHAIHYQDYPCRLLAPFSFTQNQQAILKGIEILAILFPIHNHDLTVSNKISDVWEKAHNPCSMPSPPESPIDV